MVAVRVQQLEAAAPVVVLVVAAVAASWRLVEGKMYFLPALAARTSVDRNRVFISQERRGGIGGGGGAGRKRLTTPSLEILEKGTSAKFCNKKMTRVISNAFEWDVWPSQTPPPPPTAF